MANKTLLEITNLVLRRLREDEVSSFTNEEYATLVAEMAVDIIDDINHQFEWDILVHAVTFHTVTSQSSYDLSATLANGGSADNTNTRVTTNESMVMFQDNNFPMAWYYNDDTDVVGKQLQYISSQQLRTMLATSGGQTTDFPQYIAVEPDSTTGGLKVLTWPIPNSARPITIWFHTPETRFDTSTDASREVLVDNRCVQLGTLYLALNERGEEIGEPGNIAEQRYLAALAEAKETQIRNKERTMRYDSSRN